jgi:hypothetical protein
VQVPDYDHLVLHRGVLHTPDGGIPLRRIGKGSFSTIYREEVPPGRVFAFEREGSSDKEIAKRAHAELPGNPHIPAVEYFGETATERVYVMPFYDTPLRKKQDPAGWRDYTIARDCKDEEHRKLKPEHWGYPLNEAIIACAKERGMRPAVLQALDQFMVTASDYGYDYAFEFAPRNLATDHRDIFEKLVLLDVVYSRDAMSRQRAERAARARAREPRGGWW